MSKRDHEPDRVDWLDLGPDPDEGKPPSDPRQRYLWYVGAAALVALALVLTRTQHGTSPAASTAPPAVSSSAPSPAGSSGAPSGAGSSSAPSGAGSSSPGSFMDPTASSAGPSPDLTARPDLIPVQVASLGRPLLDAPADWELFARGPGVVVRIELARGRITTTAVPEPANSTSTVFVVGSDRAIVRPLDDSPGYVVHDGKPAAELPPSLRDRLVMLPSPDQRHLWTARFNSDGSDLSLVGLDGSPAGATIDIPDGAYIQGSDGAGHVLLSGIGGSYAARPGSVRRITSGLLLASGPTRWLTVECDDNFSCANVVTDRASGARHSLSTPIEPLDRPGMISPDGRTAALLRYSGDGGIHLLDLGSGSERRVEATTDDTDYQTDLPFVWSPDSQRLFVIDVADRVLVVDRGTGRVTPLKGLMPVTQLALRHGG